MYSLFFNDMSFNELQDLAIFQIREFASTPVLEKGKLLFAL